VFINIFVSPKRWYNVFNFAPHNHFSDATRARINECEAPGKVVTTRPPKHLVQLCRISHAFISTLQGHTG